MVVVKSREELTALVKDSYVPYYHRDVKRWYLRKGGKRILIDGSLEEYAKQIAKELEKIRRREEKVKTMIEAIKLRAQGLTVREVLKKTRISKINILQNTRGNRARSTQ